MQIKDNGDDFVRASVVLTTCTLTVTRKARHPARLVHTNRFVNKRYSLARCVCWLRMFVEDIEGQGMSFLVSLVCSLTSLDVLLVEVRELGFV